MAETKRTTLEQGRAAFAYTCAENASKSLGKPKEYKAYVKKMPMLIKTNGLGAAIAFAFSKGSKNGVPQANTPWGLIYTQIENWLLEGDEKGLISFEKTKLAQKLTQVESYTYRAVTVEVLAFFGWLRRFAEGLIEGETNDPNN
ncbi:type III-B CRISPR module-associated protein Cmr5 [Rapidithrix thailandica]|uniref:CRISPR type III-B/RAMP module-associated protein Cmr5 n=1 Tax=Rapidithrix thailandica TaxID=413964 RepID=A0AAW9S5G9_9BACT